MQRKSQKKHRQRKDFFYFSPVFNIVPRRMKSRQCAIVLILMPKISFFCSPAEQGCIESRDQCSYQSGHFPIFLPTFYLLMCQKVFCHHHFATSKAITSKIIIILHIVQTRLQEKEMKNVKSLLFFIIRSINF